MTPKAVRHVPSDASRLIIQADFPRLSPSELFDYFTQPEMLVVWWPASAQVDTRLGGHYQFTWPSQDWNLQGDFTRFDPGRRLAYSWRWDHEPDMPERQVDLTFEQSGAGSALTLVHTPYDGGERDQQERVSHLEGWRFYLERLQALT